MAEEEISETEGMIHTSEGLAGLRPQEASVFTSEESRCEGSGMELNADLLVDVFSSLPQKDLLEVMLVSRHWGKAVMEADSLWKEVEVVRKWDLEGVGVEGVGGVGPPFLFRVLRIAKEVKFSPAFDHAEEHVMWVGGVLGPTLNSLELPIDCIHTPFLTSLESDFHLLKSLVIEGEPKGEDPLCVCHPNLETLDFECHRSRSLTLDCPNLTRLSIRSDVDGRSPLNYSLNCPQLTWLSLASLHTTPRVLESMAARSPNIRWLEVTCDNEWPYDALYGFRNLRHLFMKEVNSDIPHLAIQWPHLETLHVAGHNFAEDLQVRHSNLRALTIQNMWGFAFSPILNCSSLENLTLNSTQYGVQFLENLNVMCPHLKKCSIVRPRAIGGSADDPQGPLRFVHDSLEELTLVCLQYTPMHVICPKLNELVLLWVGSEVKESSFEMECPSVTTFRISGYHIKSCLPSILLALPSLKLLSISRSPIENGEVALEHSCVERVVVLKSNVNKLRLGMPGLVRMKLVDSRVRVLQVTSRGSVNFESDFLNEKMKMVVPGGEMVTIDLLE